MRAWYPLAVAPSEAVWFAAAAAACRLLNTALRLDVGFVQSLAGTGIRERYVRTT